MYPKRGNWWLIIENIYKIFVFTLNKYIYTVICFILENKCFAIKLNNIMIKNNRTILEVCICDTASN